MAITIYQYKGCSTCRKAIKWLNEQGLEFTAIPIVESPPSAAELKRLHGLSGLPLKKFFNTSGQSYRNGDWKSKLTTYDEAAQMAGLAQDGKLIKRPLLVSGDTVLVGFREAAWSEALLSS